MNKLTKTGFTLVITLALAFSLSALLPVAAVHSGTTETVRVSYAGETVCSGQTYLWDNSTYVPLRSFCALLGIDDVRWDEADAAATVTDTGLELRLKDGADYLEVNGRCFWAPDRIRVVNGVMMVPIRPLALALGLDVSWNESEQSVLVTSSGNGYAAPAEEVYNATDLYWLSRIISAESRGEPLTGQLAVGNVVLNRVADPTFPDSVYGVIFDTRFGIQFSPVGYGTIYQEPAEISVVAAKLALEGYSISSDILYFINASLASNFWVPQNRPFAVTVGSHDFYA